MGGWPGPTMTGGELLAPFSRLWGLAAVSGDRCRTCRTVIVRYQTGSAGRAAGSSQEALSPTYSWEKECVLPTSGWTPESWKS